MTREEIKDKFRQENPEITDRVLTDAALSNWCIVGDHEIVIKTRAIKSDTTFDATADVSEYDLTSYIIKFYEIDFNPGGGVIYDNDPLEFKTIAELDQIRSSWRTSTSGTPKYYYRRGKFLGFDRAPDAANDIQVYAILLSNDFDDDSKTPFNELSYLAPFHYAINLYLTMRAKYKVGKKEEAIMAMQEYDEYIKWMRTEINRSTLGAIQLRPTSAYR